MAKPHCCPVCGGTGKRPTGEMTTGGFLTWTCHPCGGSGIVWEQTTEDTLRALARPASGGEEQP